MSDETKLPSGRLGRLVRLAEIGARTGTSLLFRREGDDGAAKRAAEVLGNLRGVAAKVGQMAGYIDGLVPEEHRDAYQRSMKTLLAGAPRSSPEAIRRLVEEELGAPLDRLYAEWDDQAVASASIGQVHHARTLEGAEVAVKVQHPGVAEAVEADLKNAGLLEGALSMMGTRKVGSAKMLEEVRTRFREELDYTIEARNQIEFARIFEDDPKIVVPRVDLDRSTRRVLTSQFVRGRSLDEASGLPERDRVAICRTLWRFVYKGTLLGEMFNADPHPGNYFFQDDGRVVFLDFGCVQPIPKKRHDVANKLHRAALDRDEATFAEAAKIMLETRGGDHEKRVLSYIRRAFEPQFSSPFRITRDYVASLVHHMREAGKETLKTGDTSFVPMPEGMLFMNRLQFGFYSVLARLDVEVDYAEEERSFMV
ncbi:MAG TPA: AarF/ABC1/UbiB kinase family protein [Polyangium sp.]|nr:AarF/ABC1/UbiB kinase family protein [Polyangium sp.]